MNVLKEMEYYIEVRKGKLSAYVKKWRFEL